MLTKQDILNITGHTDIKKFYSEFPNEDSFKAKYGKQIDKFLRKKGVEQAQGGITMTPGSFGGYQPKGIPTQGTFTNTQTVNSFAPTGQQDQGIMSDLKNLTDEDIKTGVNYASAAGQAIKGYADARAGKKKAKETNEFLKAFSPVLAKASQGDMDRPNRKYLRPDDPAFLIQPDTLHNPIGSGQGLYAKNGGEIQNTFAPNTIYKDLDKANAGMVIEGIKTAGDIAAFFGGMNTKKFQEQNEQMMGQMGTQPAIQNLQANQYASYMEHGGMVNPQMATSLEGIPLTKLFAPDPYMDTLRTGGEIQKAQKGLSSIYKHPERGYISGGDTPEDIARQSSQMKEYGASFVPKEQINSFMENWNKHRGSVKDVYNKFNNATPDQFKNMSMEDIWKARFDAKKLNSETYTNVRDEEYLANKQIMTDQIRGMRSNYLPEEETIYDFHKAQKDSVENSYNKFNKLSNEQMLQKEKESGLSQLELDAKYKQLFKLRTGGNIRQNQMAMGGNLKTHWGGGAESISYNPYLPKGGETVMFRGNSHNQSDGKGRTGIGVTYGDRPVEVEGREPAIELENGSSSDTSLTVYGNLEIPSFGAQMLGDPKASGMKFKNYVGKYLSPMEERQNAIMDKSTKALDNLDVTNSFDKLSFDSYKAMMTGADMKLKDIADKKIKASSLQSAINDTAEEYSLIADDLAKGKVKQAKMGAKLSIAKDGFTMEEQKKAKEYYDAGLKSGDMSQFQKYASEIAPDLVKTSIYNHGMPAAGSFIDKKKGIRTDEVHGGITDPTKMIPVESGVPSDFSVDLTGLKKPGTIQDMVDYFKSQRNQSDNTSVESTDDKFDWMTMANQVLPYLRPTDAESLDPRQLAGEMYALSTNQVEPVRAQTLQPELSTPYDISLQDQINANQSDYRAAQRMVGYNPAAQGMLNAQKYQANQQVLGEQFRMNQAMKDRVYGENRNLINQSNLQNLGILDQQYGRQQEALSKTKATTQAALNSISSKYAQNQLENRQLQTYENMYNYRFDDRFRAMNMNPLAQFNMEGSGTSTTPFGNMSPEEIELYAKQLKVAQNKQKEMSKSKDSARNGTLVKANK